MAVDVSRTQDVYKDAGQNVNFTTLLLNRKDRDVELEVIQDMADRIQAIKRSVSIRANGEGLGIAFGFSRKAWDYLFPNAPVPKELEDFEGIKGDKQDVPAVAADLFLHVRSNDESVTYTVVDQIMEFLRPITSVVDETHGFHYEQGRAIIDFVDGTENPVGQEAVEWGVIGDEDPEFTNGSYAFAQKYEHDLDAWRALPTEMQEKFIGRRKFSDIELEDDEKDPAAHNVVAQDNRDDEEHKLFLESNDIYLDLIETMTEKQMEILDNYDDALLKYYGYQEEQAVLASAERTLTSVKSIFKRKIED
mgnify:CR=1 FL=1